MALPVGSLLQRPLSLLGAESMGVGALKSVVGLPVDSLLFRPFRCAAAVLGSQVLRPDSRCLRGALHGPRVGTQGRSSTRERSSTAKSDGVDTPGWDLLSIGMVDEGRAEWIP